MAHDNVTTVVLAGGRATRLPNKLALTLGDRPLLAHVYDHFRDAAPMVVASAGGFDEALESTLQCPMVVDRWPGRGPLAGLLSAALELRTPLLFAVAGDAPRVTPEVLDALLAAHQEHDEAVVPEHDGRLEPLAALYDRAAIEREAPAVVHESNASMHAFLERVKVRRVAMAPQFFINVNTAADLDAVRSAR